jgi:hypothetical protein
MSRRLIASIFAVILAIGIGNNAAFAAAIGDETKKPSAESKFDAKSLAAAENKTAALNFEKSSMAEYEREKAKARRMSTGKKVAIIGGIAAVGIIIAVAVGVKHSDYHTF